MQESKEDVVGDFRKKDFFLYLRVDCSPPQNQAPDYLVISVGLL
jgi:hypothetical protein